ARLPIDAWDCRFIDDHERGQSGTDGGRKVRCRELFEIKLDHYIFDDLSTLGRSVLQTVATRLHFANAALKADGQGLIGDRSPDDRREDFMQIGEPFYSIGESQLIYLGIFRAKAVADSPVVDGGKIETHGNLQPIKCVHKQTRLIVQYF